MRERRRNDTEGNLGRKVERGGKWEWTTREGRKLKVEREGELLYPVTDSFVRHV